MRRDEERPEDIRKVRPADEKSSQVRRQRSPGASGNREGVEDAGETAAPKKRRRKRPAEDAAKTERKKKRPSGSDVSSRREPAAGGKRRRPAADGVSAEPAGRKKASGKRNHRDAGERTGSGRTAGGRPKYVETVNADGVRERRTSTYSFLPEEPEPDLETLRRQREEEEQKELESGLLAEEELREGEHSEEERRAKRRAAKIRAARRRAAEQRRMRRIAIMAGALVLVLLIGFFVLHKMSGRSGKADAGKTEGRAAAGGEVITPIPADESASLAAAVTPEPASTSITLTFTGDCTFGRDINSNYDTSFDAYYEENGYEYFFKNCKSIFEADDLTIVNFEGTLTDADDSERLDKQFAFKADPSYVKIMSTTGVDAANIANNHSADYGEQSAEDTIKYLTEAGITPFGYSDSKVIDVKGIKVGFVGILELFEEIECQYKMVEQIESVKEQGAQIVIVTMHWGEEAQYYYDQDQYDLGRIAIDHGADLVIGHHPHRIQAIETYKGKNIVYSIANFCFGGNYEPSDMDSFIYQQTFTMKNGELVQDNVTNIIPISISSSPSYNNYQPTPFEDSEDIQRVMNKIKDVTAEPGVPVGGTSTGDAAAGGASGQGASTASAEDEAADEEEYTADEEEYTGDE